MQHGSYVCHNSVSIYEEYIEGRLVMAPQQYNIRFSAVQLVGVTRLKKTLGDIEEGYIHINLKPFCDHGKCLLFP
jgi:hypothetical protein